MPQIPIPDFETLMEPIATMPPMPTLALDLGADVLSPVFSLPEIPEGTIQPIIGSPPDWWYLVPIHSAAYAGGSNARDYHYRVNLPTDAVTDFYEDVMRGGGWETFMGTIPSGSASMMSYYREDTSATIYISSDDGGTLVSIIIE